MFLLSGNRLVKVKIGIIAFIERREHHHAPFLIVQQFLVQVQKVVVDIFLAIIVVVTLGRRFCFNEMLLFV